MIKPEAKHLPRKDNDKWLSYLLKHFRKLYGVTKKLTHTKKLVQQNKITKEFLAGFLFSNESQSVSDRESTNGRSLVPKSIDYNFKWTEGFATGIYINKYWRNAQECLTAPLSLSVSASNK